MNCFKVFFIRQFIFVRIHLMKQTFDFTHLLDSGISSLHATPTQGENKFSAQTPTTHRLDTRSQVRLRPKQNVVGLDVQQSIQQEEQLHQLHLQARQDEGCTDPPSLALFEWLLTNCKESQEPPPCTFYKPLRARNPYRNILPYKSRFSANSASSSCATSAMATKAGAQ